LSAAAAFARVDDILTPDPVRRLSMTHPRTDINGTLPARKSGAVVRPCAFAS
jgi:hypothetical protein